MYNKYIEKHLLNHNYPLFDTTTNKIGKLQRNYDALIRKYVFLRDLVASDSVAQVMSRDDAYYFLLDLAENIISLKDIIKEGDTVGRDANEKLKVNYTKSLLTQDNNVMRIKM